MYGLRDEMDLIAQAPLAPQCFSLIVCQSEFIFIVQEIIQITMSEFLDLPMFDELVSNMHRVAVPPVVHSQASDRAALYADSLRQEYIKQHGRVLHCIANLRRAWSSLATISPTGHSPSQPASGSDSSLAPPIDASSVGSSIGPHAPFQISTQSPSTLIRDPLSESIALSASRCDEHYLRRVFDRCRDEDDGMSKYALLDALKEVDAPVLSSNNDSDAVFRLAATSTNDHVDFAE
jgi:hypothetical protein